MAFGTQDAKESDTGSTNRMASCACRALQLQTAAWENFGRDNKTGDKSEKTTVNVFKEALTYRTGWREMHT